MAAPYFPIETGRADFAFIADVVPQGARVLDIGCGDGTLLTLLGTRRQVDGRGIELSQKGVNDCVARGLFVVQGDADRDLVNYPDDAFDFAILSQTIQATRNPKEVMQHLLRIGRRVIVSFPNFAHWRVRLSLLARGRMPVTERLAYRWYETPNIHLCTIRDFAGLVEELGAEVEQIAAFDARGRRLAVAAGLPLLNIVAEEALFVLKRGADHNSPTVQAAERAPDAS